jgi:hypothetical protein
MTQFSHPRARFAPLELTPMTPERIAEIRARAEQLAQLLSESILTNETLWEENERLQAGIDTHLEKCAELRGQLGRKDEMLRDYRARLIAVHVYLRDPVSDGNIRSCRDLILPLYQDALADLEARGEKPDGL